MVSKGYVVRLTPRYKDSRYLTHTIEPYLQRIKWSKDRATKEMEYYAKKGKLSTGIGVARAYRLRVIKERSTTND